MFVVIQSVRSPQATSTLRHSSENEEEPFHSNSCLNQSHQFTWIRIDSEVSKTIVKLKLLRSKLSFLILWKLQLNKCFSHSKIITLVVNYMFPIYILLSINLFMFPFTQLVKYYKFLFEISNTNPIPPTISVCYIYADSEK